MEYVSYSLHGVQNASQFALDDTVQLWQGIGCLKTLRTFKQRKMKVMHLQKVIINQCMFAW